jgi:ATP-dependent Clp protease ATP-binding subunit ClpA
MLVGEPGVVKLLVKGLAHCGWGRTCRKLKKKLCFHLTWALIAGAKFKEFEERLKP